MGRAPCCDKSKVKRGPWSPDEDAVLKRYVNKTGIVGNWISLPRKAGLRRCGKSCRLRWLNYLRPDIRHGNFTEEEDKEIMALYATLGSKWSIIANRLDRRTDNDVKNYWNTKLKKRYEAIKAENRGAARGGGRGRGKQVQQQNPAPQQSSRKIVMNNTAPASDTASASSSIQAVNYQQAAVNYQPAAAASLSYFPSFDLTSLGVSLQKAQYTMPPLMAPFNSNNNNNSFPCPMPFQQPLMDPYFGFLNQQQYPTTTLPMPTMPTMPNMTTTTTMPSFPDPFRSTACSGFGGAPAPMPYMVNQPPPSLDNMSGGSSSSLTFDHGGSSSTGHGGGGGGNPWTLEEDGLLSEVAYTNPDLLLQMMSSTGGISGFSGFGGASNGGASSAFMGDVKPSPQVYPGGVNYS